jgi:MYXO-CTERM domain-containing protein
LQGVMQGEPRRGRVMESECSRTQPVDPRTSVDLGVNTHPSERAAGLATVAISAGCACSPDGGHTGARYWAAVLGGLAHGTYICQLRV